MWTKKMKARVPARLLKLAKAKPYEIHPWMEKLLAKRRKALVDMGYKLVAYGWLQTQPEGMWVERAWEWTTLRSWVCRA